MKQKFLCALAGTFLSTALVWGQSTGTGTGTTHTPPTPAQLVANQVARLTALLNLTTAQQAQATTIFTNEQTASSALSTNLQAAQTALQTAIKANDQNGIHAAATQIGTLTGQQVEIHAKAEAAFWAILTADQQTRYNQLRQFGLGGPGFGGPGPGRGFHAPPPQE
jgi:Spy/CpxP family protein refolding chaperone